MPPSGGFLLLIPVHGDIKPSHAEADHADILGSWRADQMLI
jgi:hypothetical protein